jgi:transcriptional regulator with XRE-family HTH domain
MPNENYDQSKTRFGEMLQNAMADKDMSIRDLAEQIGSTYEYMRKLVRGLALPSRYMLNTLVPLLKFDRDAADRLIAADKIEKQHGSIPLELSGKDPELEPLERDWKSLTDQQKELLMSQFKSFIVTNKKHRVHAGRA